MFLQLLLIPLQINMTLVIHFSSAEFIEHIIFLNDQLISKYRIEQLMDLGFIEEKHSIVDS